MRRRRIDQEKIKNLKTAGLAQVSSYPATAGTIHEHRQQLEIGRRRRGEEENKTRHLYRDTVDAVKFGGVH